MNLYDKLWLGAMIAVALACLGYLLLAGAFMAGL
jgi:hypothetical protein